jgi:hypothetical protein
MCKIAILTFFWSLIAFLYYLISRFFNCNFFCLFVDRFCFFFTTINKRYTYQYQKKDKTYVQPFHLKNLLFCFSNYIFHPSYLRMLNRYLPDFFLYISIPFAYFFISGLVVAIFCKFIKLFEHHLYLP